MKILVLASLVAAFGMSANVSAQTCASPLPIYSNSSVSGDTCDAENTLPGYGGIASPQREVIYSFTANSADATMTINLNGLPEGAVFLMPSPCASSTDPTDFGFGGTPMVIQPGDLVDGQEYFIIVTADPGGPADACGAYEIVVEGTLPVNLQNVTVD